MTNLSLRTAGAVCAVLVFATFGLAIAFTTSSGVPTLIPETGPHGLAWIGEVDGAGPAFVVGGWLAILGGYFGIVALIGFYDALREAGRVLVIAPILGAVGLTLVTLSHLIPIAMANELVPAYTKASGPAQESLAGAFETLTSIALVTNDAGNFLGWGVAIPMLAYAILTTAVVPHWIGWLGAVVAVCAGWIGLLAPASGLTEGLSSIGFIAFFLFMLSTGIALLRHRTRENGGPVTRVAPGSMGDAPTQPHGS
jgi:hypothetical protein